METTTLGRTDLRVTRLCVGCWQAAGWASSDDERFIRTVRHALDQGCTFLDTAIAYGDGHSEQLVGQAVEGRRDDVVIATKFTHEMCRPEQVRRSLEQSLGNLKTDRIDLFQQHWPPPDVPLDETIGELERLKEEGKIRAIGVSNWMMPEWNEVSDPSRIDCLQPCYSLLWRSIEPDVLELCRRHKIAIIPYSPLCQGILAGRFKIPTDVAEDPRRRNRIYQPAMLPRALEVAQTVEEIGNKYGKSSSQTALRWLLDQAGVTAPIVGASRPEQVDENLGALDWTLDADDWRELSELSWPLSEDLDPYDTLWDWHPKKQ